MRKSFFEQLQDLPARWRLPVAVIMGMFLSVLLSFGFLIVAHIPFAGIGFPPLPWAIVIIIIVAGCVLGVLGARDWYKKGL